MKIDKENMYIYTVYIIYEYIYYIPIILYHPHTPSLPPPDSQARLAGLAGRLLLDAGVHVGLELLHVGSRPGHDHLATLGTPAEHEEGRRGLEQRRPITA